MPDTINGITLTSKGAPITAQVGTYPIIPTAAKVVVRGHYSIRYVPGTMTVSSPTMITFANKSFDDSYTGPTGTKTFSIPVGPTAGNILVVILRAIGTQGESPPTLLNVKNGGGLSFSRIGGGTFLAQSTVTTTPETNQGQVSTSMSMWYRVTSAISLPDDSTVNFDFSSSSMDDSLVRGTIVVMEYAGASPSSPVSDEVKGSEDATTDDGTSGAHIFSLPNLDLNNTTGQMAFCSYSSTNGSYNATVAPSGYTMRYGLGDSFPFANPGFFVFDRLGLSGVGPETPTLTLSNVGFTPPNMQDFVGMAAAFTR